jgi:hypothetical protein
LLPFLLWAAVAAAPSSASAGDSSKDRARQHYKKATQLYDIGRWDEAIAEYEKAYALHEDPSLLFNMAQTCRRKGDLKRALDLYKNYLVKEPESPLRGEVEDRIRTLKTQVEQGEQSNEAQKPAAVAPPALVPVPPVVVPASGPAPGAPPLLAPAPAAVQPLTSAPAPAASAPPAAPAPLPVPAAAPAPVAPQPLAGTPAASPVPTAPAVYQPVYRPMPLAAPPAQPSAAPVAPIYPMPPPAYYAYPPAQTGPAAPPPAVYAPPAGPRPMAPAPAPIGVGSQSPAPPAPVHAETGSSGLPLLITGALLTLGGVACLGAGVYYGVETKLISNRASSAKKFNPSDDSAGKNAQQMQWVYGSIGVGGIVVGGILYAIGGWQRDSRKSSVSVVPQIQPNGAMLAATGAF